MEREKSLEELERETEVRAKRLQVEFEEKVNPLKDRIKSLQAERLRILKGKLSPKETIEKFKRDWEEGRQKWVEEFLASHLRVYQGRIETLKNLDHLAAHTTQGISWFAFNLFSAVNGEMIDRIGSRALENAPDEGERNRRAKELDKQIFELTKQLEALLK